MNEITHAYWKRAMDWHRQAKELRTAKVQWAWLPLNQPAKFITVTPLPKVKRDGQALLLTRVQPVTGASLHRWDDDGGAESKETRLGLRTVRYQDTEKPA